MDVENGHQVGDQIFHNFVMGLVGVSSMPHQDIFDKQHVLFGEFSNLWKYRGVILKGRNIEDIAQFELKTGTEQLNNRCIGGHVAESLAFSGCFDQDSADHADAKKAVYELQDSPNNDIAPFRIFPVESYDLDIHRFFTGRLSQIPDFEKNMVQEKAAKGNDD
jgi:hypothetical protein